jgi:hypothetical protein
MTCLASLGNLSDAQLLSEVGRLSAGERQATAHLIAALAEVDARRLYLDTGCSSLFTYCTQILHLSEHAAYGRIEAARAARRFPVILDRLADGSITLTAICLLSSHLTTDNHRALLDAVRHQTKRTIEQLVARLRPQPDVPSTIRKLPPAKTPAEPSSLGDASKPADVPGQHTCTQAWAPDVLRSKPAEGKVGAHKPSELPRTTDIPAFRPPTVVPLAPERYKVQFTVSRETHDKLRRAQDLMRHVIPNGDPAAIFDRALTVLLDELAKTKCAATERPRTKTAAASKSRHIPAAVKRAVWNRDAGRCAFVGSNGRCRETGLLEFHHVVSYADGGQAVIENLELRCRAHNAYEAERHFGPLLVREVQPIFAAAFPTRSGPSEPLPYPQTAHARSLLRKAGQRQRASQAMPGD